MKNCISIDDLFVADVKYCIDRREAYPGEEKGMAVGDLVAKNAIVLRLNDRYIPFYLISNESDFDKILQYSANGNVERCGKRAMAEFPAEIGDNYVVNVGALLLEGDHTYVGYDDIKAIDDEWGKLVGEEDYSVDQYEL